MWAVALTVGKYLMSSLLLPPLKPWDFHREDCQNCSDRKVDTCSFEHFMTPGEALATSGNKTSMSSALGAPKFPSCHDRDTEPQTFQNPLCHSIVRELSENISVLFGSVLC